MGHRHTHTRARTHTHGPEQSIQKVYWAADAITVLFMIQSNRIVWRHRVLKEKTGLEHTLEKQLVNRSGIWPLIKISPKWFLVNHVKII